MGVDLARTQADSKRQKPITKWPVPNIRASKWISAGLVDGRQCKLRG